MVKTVELHLPWTPYPEGTLEKRPRNFTASTRIGAYRVYHHGPEDVWYWLAPTGMPAVSLPTLQPSYPKKELAMYAAEQDYFNRISEFAYPTVKSGIRKEVQVGLTKAEYAVWWSAVVARHIRVGETMRMKGVSGAAGLHTVVALPVRQANGEFCVQLERLNKPVSCALLTYGK